MDNFYCKCNNCNSILEGYLIESPCPFCNEALDYKQSSSIVNYFSIPKLNNPLDYTIPTIPFEKKTKRNYLTRNNTDGYHLLSIVPIFKFINDRKILKNLCIVWDNDFNDKAYGIMQNVKDNLTYNLNHINFENIFITDKENYIIRVFSKIVPSDCKERFLRNFEEINSSFNCSDSFSIYNSINWDLLDNFNEKKTIYEYSAVNYLLHIFELIKVPNIDVFDYETKLLSFDSIVSDLNLENTVDSYNKEYTAQQFLDKFYKTDVNPFLEDVSFDDFEDVFDYFSEFNEGAIAPNAVGLNTAANRSISVYNKLYDLGYNPKMHIYSLEEATSLCPTYEKDGIVYYIECNNNIMMGINEFESLDDMKDVLNEVYNPYNLDNLFITIEGLTADILKFIVNNSKDSKELLSRLISLNSKKQEDFIYSQTVQDEEDFKNSIVSQFDIKEMNPQNLFKYGRTFYKLRNCRNLAGNQHGYMFIDENDNIAGYIIIEDKVYNTEIGNRTFRTVVALDATSEFKDKGIEIAMIDYYKKKNNVNNLRIECRNFNLAAKIENTNEYNKLDLNTPYIVFESINESKEFVLNEAINANKRKQIEEKIYKTFDLLDKTGSNTQKYKTLFKSMSDEKFDKYIKELINDNKKNFYLEVLPNKNCPRIKDCKDALDYLKVPTEEYVYYKHDGHEQDPIRSRYKVPVLYVNLRRLQQMLSKKNTYSLEINKRNMKTG